MFLDRFQEIELFVLKVILLFLIYIANFDSRNTSFSYRN